MKSKKDGESILTNCSIGSSTQDLDDLTIQCQDMNRNYMRRISEFEVKKALKRMKSRKTVGPDGIPSEVWRCLEEVGMRWLLNLFNKIWLTKKMPNGWRRSTLVPLCKNKGARVVQTIV